MIETIHNAQNAKPLYRPSCEQNRRAAHRAIKLPTRGRWTKINETTFSATEKAISTAPRMSDCIAQKRTN